VEEPVPCYVAFEGRDPHILETRPHTTVDAVMDAHADAVAAGLSREDTIEHMAHVLSGAQPYRSSKASKQPAGRGGASWWGGQGRVRGGARVIEAKAERGWLGRR
jgi:hypothetical protein